MAGARTGTVERILHRIEQDRRVMHEMCGGATGGVVFGGLTEAAR